MLLRSRLILLKLQPIAFEAAPPNWRFFAVRFCSGSTEQSENMEKAQEQQKPPATAGDIMSDSFGHGYATRTDEEGFGGIYGRNQSLKTNGDEDEHNSSILEQNDGQGSKVKQEEKGKHQEKGAN